MFLAKQNGKRGEIFIYEDIGEGWGGGISAKRFSEELKKVGDVADIDVYINSPGGSVFEGIAIYNQLVRHKARITTHIDGIAASIASIIALAGDERSIAANGTFMIHNPWTFAIGEADDLRKTADTMDKLRDTLLDTYVSKTGGKRELIGDMMNAETWMNAKEALEQKFVTKVVEEKQIDASFTLVAKFKNAPKELLSRATDSRLQIARMAAGVHKIGRASSTKA